MPSLIDMRRRIRAVKSTQQITKAMKMVSAAKLRRAQEAIFAARPYARKMMEVLNELASRAPDHAHPLLEDRGPGRTLLVGARCLAPVLGGNYLRVELRQHGMPDADNNTVAVQIVPARNGEDLLYLAFSLHPQARTLELHWSNAFDGEVLVLADLQAQALTEALPLAAVGHAVADTRAAAAAVRDILDHLDHYKRQSAQFAVSCAQHSSAGGIVAALIAVSRY